MAFSSRTIRTPVRSRLEILQKNESFSNLSPVALICIPLPYPQPTLFRTIGFVGGGFGDSGILGH